METVTLTFWLIMLVGSLAALASAAFSLDKHGLGGDAHDARNALARDVATPSAPRNVRVRHVAKDWRLSNENVHAFLTLSRAKAAQQGRCTRLHTLALSRMGEI